ncbi:alkaline phosphatase D family protein [Schlegelella aquatica]|uniref:alkaline phosphatase D family protein n=1 Tax=Caldimonas aquatica TaxID=376175 RepID=UPI0037508D07
MQERPHSLLADASRRRFIRDLAVGGVALGSGLGLAGCGGGDDDDDDRGTTVTFVHGVASGDPLADRVILWTRATPSREETLRVRWEVATDAGFSQLVASGEATTSAAADYTVKVDVTGLQPGRSYFYRFRHGEAVSPVGRTRTLPTGAVERVRMAVFSCSNYPAGYFNVYAAAAQMGDLDVAVHLGDYIYEFERGGYADQNAAQLGRESQPATELVTLADYRTRHAQYKTDPDLQALHAAVPMIAVWDDHEMADNAWKQGAANHQPATEGDFVQRRAAALQAYYEWMPVRAPDPANPLRIYRSFDFGNLLSLHMLDTRLIGRDQPRDLMSYVRADGSFDQARFEAEVGAADRQLLGAEQAAWLQQRLQSSTATWQVLGQQVLMGRMEVPAPVLFHLRTGGQMGVSLEDYLALLAKQQTDPSSLTPEELAVLGQPALPYNLDAWDGYPAQREAVFEVARGADKNLVVLAGDTHNAWASDLATQAGAAVGVEFATSSVSSPGFEAYLPSVLPSTLASALEALIDPLRYAETSRRGFMVVTATPAECRADWYFVDTIAARSAAASLDKSLKVLPGASNRKVVDV